MTAGRHTRRSSLAGLALAAALLLTAPASGAEPAADLPHIGPFVSHRLALQLSDRAPDKQALIISVANNMLKVYGPDRISIDVVAFGPGIDLLRAGSPEKEAVDSLVAQGVRFDVCMNTVTTIKRDTGKTVALNPHAHHVQAGVAQLLTLAEHGYTLVRP